MAWDAFRAKANPDAVADALTTYEAGVSSIDGYEVTKVSSNYVLITVEYTA